MNFLAEEEKEKEKKMEHDLAEGKVTSPGGKQMAEEIRAVRISNNHIERIDEIFCLSTLVNFENILWIGEVYTINILYMSLTLHVDAS